MTDKGVTKIVLHDRATFEVIEVDPRNIRQVETLHFADIGTFSRVHLAADELGPYVDVSEMRDLILRALQMGFNFEALKKSGARRHP